MGLMFKEIRVIMLKQKRYANISNLEEIASEAIL